MLGSFSPPSSSVSAIALIDESGVLNSCETLLTNSPPRGLDLPQFREVVQGDQHGSARLFVQRSRDGAHRAATLREYDLGVLRLPGLATGGDKLPELMVVADGKRRFRVDARIDSEERRGRPVEELHIAGRVHDDHPVGHGLHNGGQLVSLTRQVAHHARERGRHPVEGGHELAGIAARFGPDPVVEVTGVDAPDSFGHVPYRPR